MAGEQIKTGSASLISSTRNRVPEMIRQIQAAKATGKFTFQAGRGDAALNMLVLGMLTFSVISAGRSSYMLATGKGKKDM